MVGGNMQKQFLCGVKKHFVNPWDVRKLKSKYPQISSYEFPQINCREDVQIIKN